MYLPLSYNRRLLDTYRKHLALGIGGMPASFYEGEIASLEKTILLLEQYDMVARLCIVKNLPAGDPCWMAKMICSFIMPLDEDDDDDDRRWRCCNGECD